MADNYVLLEKIVVGATAVASVTFNSIPQTGYTDLVIKTSPRRDSASGSGAMSIEFNGLSTNLSTRALVGTGTTSQTDTYTFLRAGSVGNSTDTANTFESSEIYIPNYASSNYKSVLVDDVQENNTAGAFQNLISGLWASTAAITSIRLFPTSGANFVQYSSFSLYGVAKKNVTPVIAPFATGGDVIQSDGTYWYHAFRSSGTFTPLKALSCDVLVVAGGGGAGLSSAGNTSGGGGAGQVTNVTGRAFTANTAYTTTIGGGGAISLSTSAAGSQGSTSSIVGSGFTTVSASGGGGGGSSSASATQGGSGGGGSNQLLTGGSANGSNTNAGSNGFNSTNASGGSGGGAGGVGTVGTNTVASNGGAGINTYSTWHTPTGTGVSGFIAGGGAGGYYSTNASYTVPTGGSGGGGNGGYYYGGTIAEATAGIANTGSGGGAYGLGTGGGAGGSGLVIIRYPMV